MNIVVIRGRVNRRPDNRLLPSGDGVTTLEITVPGADGQRAESVPVAAYNAPCWVMEVPEGEEVVVAGRVRRRFFRAGGSTASRTEVVADQIVAVDEGRTVRALLNRTAAAIAPPAKRPRRARSA